MPLPPDPKSPKFTTKGAACDPKSGRLQASAYQEFRKNFLDEWRCKHPQKDSPGLREDEEAPEGVKLWDDWKTSKKDTMSPVGLSCGWIAKIPGSSKSVWFNTKATGSWRLSFLLARLQRKIWEERLSAGKSVNPSKSVFKKSLREKSGLSRITTAAKKTSKRSEAAAKREAAKREKKSGKTKAASFKRVAGKFAKKAMKPTKALKVMKAVKQKAGLKAVKAELKAVKAEPGVRIKLERGAREAVPGVGPCARQGCPFFKTWHRAHCCTGCARGREHGPWCERKVNPAIQTTRAMRIIRSLEHSKQKRTPRYVINQKNAEERARRLAKTIEHQVEMPLAAKGFKSAAEKLAKGFKATKKATVAAALTFLKVKLERVEVAAPAASLKKKTAPHASPKKTKVKVSKGRRPARHPRTQKMKLEVKAKKNPVAKAGDGPVSPQKRKVVSRSSTNNDVGSTSSPRKGTVQPRCLKTISGKFDKARRRAELTQQRKPVVKVERRTIAKASSVPATSSGQRIFEDAPPGHIAFSKISFQEARDMYEIRLPVSEASSPGQPHRANVSLARCGGSREDAARIARMMYWQLDQGTCWEGVKAWKSSMYSRWSIGEKRKARVQKPMLTQKRMSDAEALSVVGNAPASRRHQATNDRLVDAILAAENIAEDEFDSLLAAPHN